MNHLDSDEQAMVRKRPKDFALGTRNDVADQQVPEPQYFCPDHDSDRRQDRILADMRDIALAARGQVDEAQEHSARTVTLRDAAQGFSKLVNRVKAGEMFVITVRGVETARLCPVVPRIDAKEEA